MKPKALDRLELTDEQIDEFAEYYFGPEFLGERGTLFALCNQAKSVNGPKIELHGSLKPTEVDSMNWLRIEALRERDEARRKLSDAIASMESAIRILCDKSLDVDRIYECRAYLRSRIEVAAGKRNVSDILCAVDTCRTPKGCSLFGCAGGRPPIARPVCPVTHKECSAAEPCHAPECELAVL